MFGWFLLVLASISLLEFSLELLWPTSAIIGNPILSLTVFTTSSTVASLIRYETLSEARLRWPVALVSSTTITTVKLPSTMRARRKNTALVMPVAIRSDG